MIAINIGDKFALLTIISESDKDKNNKRVFICQCICGKITPVMIYDLVRGHTKSCGCLRKTSLRKTSQLKIKHHIKIGDRFERLEVIGLYFQPGHRIVNCKCDCGNFTNILVSNLVSGKVKSCGCYHKDIMASENPWLTEYNSYKDHCAIRRDLEWELSVNDFTNFVTQNCGYCGATPNTITKVSKLKRNGIDRINNNMGYILGNCIPCCKICNHAKNDMSHDQFITWIKQLYANIIK